MVSCACYAGRLHCLSCVIQLDCRNTMAVPEDKERERVYKVVLLGNSPVGKTSFVERYVNNRFSGTNRATIAGIQY